MGYISAEMSQSDRGMVTIWERIDGVRSVRQVKAPYYFYIEDTDGEHVSMDGTKLSKVVFDSSNEMYEARVQLKQHDLKVYESDISPVLRVLSREYYGKPAPKLNVTFLDIEVDYDPTIGFSNIGNEYAPINAIAMYHTHSNRTVVLAVPPKGYEYSPGPASQELINEIASYADIDYSSTVEISLYSSEKELLMKFLEEIHDSDLLSGWNSDFFDIPYIGARLAKLGKGYFNMLSFPEASHPKWREIELMNKQTSKTLDLKGRISVDYLELFRKYEMAERPSYKLEAIADEMLPDLPKLEYEGSLARLYNEHFAYFIRYNLRDTEILRGFEDKLGYVELANQMRYISTALFDHVGGTLKLAELATINYCHHELGIVVNDVSIPDSDGKIKGAVVLLPQIGLHERLGSVDLNSLYPSAIRSLNISPETLIGQFTEEEDAYKSIANRWAGEYTLEYEDGRSERKTVDEWVEYLTERKWAVSGFGTVFDQSKPGIIPSILTSWYDTRKKYQRKVAETKNSLEELYKEHGKDTSNMPEDVKKQVIELKGESEYYDRLQYVYKIKLNSFYGALNNKFFRFYDLRMGSSTTACGRAILIHQCAETCKQLDGKYQVPDRMVQDEEGNIHYGYTDKWSVIYGDTDSTYFKTHGETDEEAIAIADTVGELVNASFPEFMRRSFLCTDGYDTIMKTGREIVSDRGIFVDKKRYILHLINDDGYPVDKTKVMGLDTKKTTLPKKVATDLNKFIERFLKGEDWNDVAEAIVEYKEDLLTRPLLEIGLPKGVSKVESYTMEYSVDPSTRLPGHIAASIMYNACLQKFGDKESTPIVSGTKIKVFYMKKPIGRFKSIAVPTDTIRLPEWFEENIEVDKSAHIKRLVDNPINNIIKAIGKIAPSRQTMLVENLFEF